MQCTHDANRLRGGKNVAESGLVGVGVDRHANTTRQMNAEVGIDEVNIGCCGQNYPVAFLQVELLTDIGGGQKATLPQLLVRNLFLSGNQCDFIRLSLGIFPNLFFDRFHDV